MSGPETSAAPPSRSSALSDARRAMAEEVVRDNGRDDPREFVRNRPREPHEKFELPSSLKRGHGMDYLWASLKIPYSTQRSPRMNQFRQAGWQFVRAADCPELSGYKPDAEVNQRFIELGIDQEVRADDPVIMDNNSVLMMRPKQLTEQAETEDRKRARSQIEDFLTTQRQRSERAIGTQRTRMTRSYGPAQEAPSDADTEI